ncbi:nucleotidyltransferase family protein [Crenobacter intestini]|uniref:Nucleotidyltransferase n=1 Tax=Crenobacter intestini TaxID=2563443 RepID=A0A4T0UJ35_9NEIS|nr:nucleotidyltransferase family protein [Crenobacter intestini]TIC78549.1 nucleotidyltransferase [Crenobacter intestini]
MVSKKRIGALKGRLDVPDDFDAPAPEIERLFGASGLPSVALELYREAIRELVGQYHFANQQVFGSVLHGTDDEGSDLDILVDALPDATLFDLAGLRLRLSDLLGVKVDLLTAGALPDAIKDKVLAGAKPV